MNVGSLCGGQQPDFPTKKNKKIRERSNFPVKHDRHFQPKNWPNQVLFARATGLRCAELRDLRIQEVYTNECEQLVVYVKNGKGGKSREVPVLPEYEQDMRAVIEGREPEEHVFDHIPTAMDVQSYRRGSAQSRYQHHTQQRPLPPAQGRLKPTDYDADAAKKVSNVLDHQRKSIVLTHFEHADRQMHHAASLQDGKEEAHVIMAQNGDEALSRSPLRRMIVLGGPGMGKTTLLKSLLQQAIYAAQNDRAAPLPLFISLPDLARSGKTLQTYLPSILAELGIDTTYSNFLLNAINEGYAFLCLDSLDEVVPAQRADIIALINREAVRCGGTWIIGSRFTEYKGGQFIHGQFTEWELQALDHIKWTF
jgi:NACHT domain